MVGGPSLGKDLLEQAKWIEDEAHAVGLDFFEVVFEMLDARDVNAVAAYMGFPVRYPSWRFGMENERLQKGYSYGLSKIYELVINNDPTYAYLVRSNSRMEQKLVMAHVFGHADFFKHNVWFAPTERNMIDVMSRHASRVRDYMNAVGQDEVERFMDLALSLDTLIDPYLALRGHLRKKEPRKKSEGRAERARRSLEAVSRSPLERTAAADSAPPPEQNLTPFDVLGFLAENAPLAGWQRDILRIVRREAYYFMPQRMTKIINEGWASYWHSQLLTSRILDSSEIIEFADCHSGATAAAPGQINPYKLGIDLFRHAADSGLDLFRLRRVHNDVSFVDEVFDEAFAQRHSLFIYERNKRTGKTEVAGRGWRDVKEELLKGLAWGGMPQIELVGEDEGELHLQHCHDGRDLKLSEAGEMIRQIAVLWKAPVHLTTFEEGAGRRIVSDGTEVQVLETKTEGEGTDGDGESTEKKTG
jgi:stage V sporulation protein R